MGAEVEARIGSDCGIGIGMMVAGVSRFGKCETRGVPGGGSTKENSEARDERSVCLGDKASKRLVLPERSATKDWGVISGGYSEEGENVTCTDNHDEVEPF